MADKNIGSQLLGCGIVVLGTFTVLAGLIVGAYVLHGIVLLFLWRWFVEPLGFPALSLAWAIGIGCTASFLTNHNVIRKGDKEIDSWKYLASELLYRPGITLATGWILHHFWGPR